MWDMSPNPFVTKPTNFWEGVAARLTPLAIFATMFRKFRDRLFTNRHLDKQPIFVTIGRLGGHDDEERKKERIRKKRGGEKMEKEKGKRKKERTKEKAKLGQPLLQFVQIWLKYYYRKIRNLNEKIQRSYGKI